MGRSNVDPVSGIYSKAPRAMLHCPRCSGSLQVNGEPGAEDPVGDTRLPPLPTTAPQQPAAAAPSCPSGALCPYEQQRLQQQQRSSTSSDGSGKASIYLSGGGIIVPSTATSVATTTTTSSSESQNQQQQHFLRPQPPRLDLLQQQQQQQQVLVATTSASLSGLQSFAGQPPQLISQQPFPVFQPAPLQQQHVPLLITSTIHQPVASMPGAMNLSQPPTPAIVVGSTGNPFFAPQQQQLVSGRPLSSIQIPIIAAAPVIQPTTQPQLFNLIAAAPATVAAPVLPPTQPAPAPAPSPPVHNPTSIQEILTRNRARLEECHWYYPTLTWNESSALLENAAPGTFLVRDSADVRFLFSLSVQRTKKEGPTSVRIHFTGGKFKLDAEAEILHLMPEFNSVLDLIDHYLCPKKKPTPVASGSSSKPMVWLDSMGQESSQISLKQPLYQNVPSLAHLSRLATNGAMAAAAKRPAMAAVPREVAVATLGLPKKLESYLHAYPNRV